VSTAAAAVVPAGIAPAGLRPESQPSRARDVQLLGEFAGSGYRETPTLVRRGDGQLIKLTPLLYQLVDAIDGRRGHEDLACELSRRVGKRATADDVSFLIEHKLRPLGVLRQTDGLEPEVARANPLLVLRPRFVISKAEVTRWITSPFVWLFSPVVVLPLLLAFCAVASWLLVEKGLSSALHQAFYEPSLLLVIWALVVLSAAFHEVGHAAACRYGGARPGVIGGGLYLIWPAFYTEVSDAYRLSRRGRLRVDLGGLYFSAIFAVATAGLWVLTRQDALLLVIAVQGVQMVRQLAPFIRADGYHILADLIGVPDLFAHIKPTLMGLLPARWRRPGRGALKPWARAVVTGWVLLTVPLLASILVMIVLTFPRLAATAWDSLGLRWDETTSYLNAGDPAGAATSAISLLLVTLPVLSIVYLVSYLVWRVARRSWRETAGRPRRRALALLGVGGLIALLAWAWWPGDGYRTIDAQEPGPLPSVVAPPLPVAATYPVAIEPVAALLPPAPVAAVPATPVVASQPIPRVVYLLGSRSLPATVDTLALPGAAPGPPTDGIAVGMPASPLSSEPAWPATDPGLAQPPAEPDEASGWPFPFDAPEAPGPEDTRAMAVNTVDGTALWDFAFSLLLLEDGDPVDQANEAHAYASCTSCVAGAVAFQVLLIVGQVDTIVPVNAAVAANYDCVQCHTFAFAFQIVATLTQAPGQEVQRRLGLALQRLADLQANISALTPSEVYLSLLMVKQDILEALGSLLAVDTSAGSQEVEQGVEAPPQQEPTTPGVTTPEDVGAQDGEAAADVPVEVTTPPADAPETGAGEPADETGTDGSTVESGAETSMEEHGASAPVEETDEEAPTEETGTGSPPEETEAETSTEEPSESAPPESVDDTAAEDSTVP
jgi:putative peptide zinc metalloprotease protein